ncbi:LIM domain and actin-binding protein 1, partial [Fragariocoptes setiger]
MAPKTNNGSGSSSTTSNGKPRKNKQQQRQQQHQHQQQQQQQPVPASEQQPVAASAPDSPVVVANVASTTPTTPAATNNTHVATEAPPTAAAPAAKTSEIIAKESNDAKEKEKEIKERQQPVKVNHTSEVTANIQILEAKSVPVLEAGEKMAPAASLSGAVAASVAIVTDKATTQSSLSSSSSSNITQDNKDNKNTAQAKPATNGAKATTDNAARTQRRFSSQSSQDENSNCKVCDKHVYQMERILAVKSIYHKQCFRCLQCNIQLRIDNFASHEGRVYCKAHHRQLFQPKPTFDADDNDEMANKLPAAAAAAAAAKIITRQQQRSFLFLCFAATVQQFNDHANDHVSNFG